MNPMITRVALVAVGCAVLIAAIIAEIIEPPKPVVEVQYVITTDAKDLLGPLIGKFNKAGEKSGGRRIEVQVLDETEAWGVDEDNFEGTPSGEALRRINDGALQPVAWTPASSLWGELLTARGMFDLVHEPDRAPQLVRSPQVVAMFTTSAEREGLSETEPLKKLLDLSASGELKFAHTDPRLSTSGLSAVYSEFRLAASSCGKSLTPGTVRDDQCVREEVRRWESSVVHYVDIAKDFIELWCDYGDQFADAAYMQETTFIEANRVCANQFTAIYPTDVPLMADYRFLVLDAPWVSAEERRAADEFGRWLAERLRTECSTVAEEHGFRRQGCPRPPGVGRTPVTDQKRPPKPTALAEAQLAWTELRRPANVMLVVDASSGMAPAERLPTAKQALSEGEGTQAPFVACPLSQDKIGMMVVGGEPVVETVVDLAPYDHAHKRALIKEIRALVSRREGRPTIFVALDEILSRPEMQDKGPINTIIVLALGADEGSSASAADLARRVSELPVQILAVPYDDRGTGPLKEIVKASLGRWYPDSYFEDGSPQVENVSEFLCRFL